MVGKLLRIARGTAACVTVDNQKIFRIFLVYVYSQDTEDIHHQDNLFGGGWKCPNGGMLQCDLPCDALSYVK